MHDGLFFKVLVVLINIVAYLLCVVLAETESKK